MGRHFYITGYMGEGAERMLADLDGKENVTLVRQALCNRYARFLFYRIGEITDWFKRCNALKKCFYPWYSVLKEISFPGSTGEVCVVFFNSGFCRELDTQILKRLKVANEKIKLVLYIVDPMVGFSEPEHFRAIEMMDLVYCINKADCEKYGFRYYPLVYSVVDRDKPDAADSGSDLYYLGSGKDRSSFLQEIYSKCQKEDIKADFHVLGDASKKMDGIHFHNERVPYEKNVDWILQSNCLLEVMHKDFDNPTQRYTEAVAYNKKLLTNNEKTKEFAFYNPRYISVFQSPEDLDMDFIRRREPVDYGYRGEFSPVYFLEQIEKDLRAV